MLKKNQNKIGTSEYKTLKEVVLNQPFESE